MQFNSFIFILVLLPATIIGYFLLNKVNITAGKLGLIAASIVFYAYGGWQGFLVLLASMFINYLASVLIVRAKSWHRLFLAVPVIINVGLLLYFKYLNFAIESINLFCKTDFALKELILPVGVSFFTFQQIAYIVSVYRGELKENNLLDYALYILYFPKILMGPLMEPADFITQINDEKLKKLNIDNIACGVKIFSFGLFKKVVLADTFALAVTWGYDNIDVATSMDWILVMIFYSLEIYLDFSGYTDMAVGASYMLNITLPMNFDSPYKAISIRDFWKRWHITLTKFFTKYIYIPMGGSRCGALRTYLNILIIFLISGLWHGANWTFILWGLLHGAFMIFDRAFENPMSKAFEPFRWLLTMMVLGLLWLLFRSDSVGQWIELVKTIFFLNDTSVHESLLNVFLTQETPFLTNVLPIDIFVRSIRGCWMLIYTLCTAIVCLVPDNNYRRLDKINAFSMIGAAICFIWGLISLCGESVFLYFNF